MSDRGQAGMAFVAQDGITGGMLLRQAREAAGLHVAGLAASLKVPVRKLEALEADRFDLLPDLVFVRALASSICRTLRIDPRPVLERLPHTAAPRLAQDRDGINAPFRGSTDVVGPGWRDQLSRPVVLAVFGLLLAALVLIFLPRSLQDDVAGLLQPKGESEPAEVAANAALVVTQTPVPAGGSAGVADTAGTVMAEASGQPSQPAVVLSPSPVLASAPPDMAAAPVPAASKPADPMPAEGVLVFRTREPSWVEVTDARGVVTLRRLLGAGESAGVSGALPLSVTIGKASVTEVQVRGKPFDLAAVARDDVARFQVK